MPLYNHTSFIKTTIKSVQGTYLVWNIPDCQLCTDFTKSKTGVNITEYNPCRTNPLSQNGQNPTCFILEIVSPKEVNI